VLGDGFYGIDLFKTKHDGYLCNEINHNPDFSFSSTIHKVDVAKHFIGYLKHAYC
jgi:glutathione synthase/RimK-type ligase-like ATP-grasp enzyme